MDKDKVMQEGNTSIFRREDGLWNYSCGGFITVIGTGEETIIKIFPELYLKYLKTYGETNER